ncbi:MAG: hypothetical protein IE935_15385, partial [Micrococcales bacterium]|nr:hypothetical protein [Micrococcales bacterium]
MSRTRALLATLLTLALVLAGALASPPVMAAEGPHITVSPSTDLDPEAAHTLTVSGTGFVGDGAVNGVYVLFGTQSVWSGGGPLVASGWIAQAWVQSAQITDGSFTTTLTVPEGSLESGVAYHVATSAAHALSATNRTMDTFASVTVAAPAPEPDPEPDPDPEPVATVETSVVSVDAADGATVSITGSGLGEVTGAYAAIIERGRESQVTSSGGHVAFGYWMTPGAIVDGAFTKTLVAPTAGLDASKQYEVIVWQGHTLPTAETIYARADIPFTTADWNTL